MPYAQVDSLLPGQVEAELGFWVADQLAADVEGDAVERAGEGERHGAARPGRRLSLTAGVPRLRGNHVGTAAVRRE